MKNSVLASGLGFTSAVAQFVPASAVELIWQLAGALASYYVLEWIKKRKEKSKIRKL